LAFVIEIYFFSSKNRESLLEKLFSLMDPFPEKETFFLQKTIFFVEIDFDINGGDKIVVDLT
jgi:hypothetical protein